MNVNDRERLLKMIQAEDFTVYETALYLDGHPCDMTALAFYNQHRDAVEALKREYRQNYGPLTIYENEDCNRWQWVNSPWPGEKEAN